jgi:hypothetical protein
MNYECFDTQLLTCVVPATPCHFPLSIVSA